MISLSLNVESCLTSRCNPQYGSEVSPGNFNGMLGEVMDGTADFAIGDISITSVRASNFAFSMPWMNLGISILYVKPRAAPPSLLAFLDPFTTDVSRPELNIRISYLS